MLKEKAKRTESRSDTGKQCALSVFWYTLLFLIVSAGVFFWFIENNRSLCWTRDASSQYIPKVYYFMTSMKEMLGDLLNGELAFRMYDFHIGMGEAVPLHTEPVYWLYLLFDESHVEIAYGFLILLRFYLAGLSFSLFLRYFQYSRWQSLIGSMVYVFSGYGLFAGLRHSHFIIPMITLPLLLLAMEEIYRKKRWYLCTVFVALSLWCGYYFTYMNTLVMGIYFLIRFFFGPEKKSVSVFCGRMGTIIGSYLLGIGIANITFFNTFANYLTSSRTGVETEQRISLWSYGKGWFTDIYQIFLSGSISSKGWLLLGFIPLSYLCIELLFLRKGNRELKTAFLLGTFFCMVPVFGFIFSGFGSLNNRWCYAFAFVVSVITAKMVGELKTISGKELLCMFVGIVPYLYLGAGKKLLHQSTERAVLVAGISLAGSYLVIVLINKWKKESLRIFHVTITALSVVLLWESGMLCYSSAFQGMAGEFTKRGNVLNQASDTPLKVLDELEDTTFYRSYSRKTRSEVQGASMILGYNGIVYYSSTLGKSMIDFYREMGLTSWSLVRVRGFDSRGYLESLGAVKYLVLEEKEDYEIPYGYGQVKEILRNDTYYRVYENENVLPLGYCYDQVITTEELEQADTPARQEMMLQAAVVDQVSQEEEAYHVAPDEIPVSGQKIPVDNITFDGDISFDGKQISVNEKDASMTIRFDGMERSETYLNLESLRLGNSSTIWFYISSDDEKNDISYYYHGDYHTYATKQEDYLFNLGYSEKAKTYCTIRFSKKCTLSVDDISVYCQPMETLKQYTTDRKETVLENVKEGTNRVSGTVNTPKDQLLVLSIPYQNGWSAYVDGEKVPVQKVNIMYMGLNLKAGEHEIELCYEMPGIRISIKITIISLGIFAAALLIRRRRRNAEKS